MTKASDRISGIAAALAEGACTVPDIASHAQRRIARFNPAYRAFSHLADDLEAQAAKLQDELVARGPRSPLHGLAVSVKGNIPVAGLPWTEGSALHAGRIAGRDATIVARARRAGGLVLGTTTLSELAMYGVTNPFEPMGVNPWNPARTAGGSSTGAGVAAALDMAHVNIGTDAGGSIRNPACHCGVVGFMPRIGALSAEGKANYAPSVSSVSLIARCVEDVEIAYRVLAEAPPSPQMPSKRVLVLRALVETMCDDETLALFGEATTALVNAGFVPIDADIPEWLAGERAAGIISLAEGGRALAAMDLANASPGIRARAAAAARLSAEDVAQARAAAAALARGVADILAREGADAILTPTWPFAAPDIEADTVLVQGKPVPVDPHRNCFVRAANAIDACALTLPMGIYASAGVPAGIHLVSTGGNEARLLSLARAAEAALPALPLAPPLRATT